MIKRDVKIVGKITEEIANRHNMSDYKNRPIVQSLDFYIHIAKHVKEFKSVDNYILALDNIEHVLKEPEFTFYDKTRESILYYGVTNDNVCYVIKLNLSKDSCYLASLYPISKKKLERQRERSYLRVE